MRSSAGSSREGPSRTTRSSTIASPIRVRDDLLDARAMLGVEAVGDAQERGQLAQLRALLLGQRATSAMICFARAASLRCVRAISATISRAGVVEAGDARPPDHVLAVLVMAARVHDLADVVEQRRDLEQHAAIVGHAVDIAELVEQRARELADVLAVRGVVIDAVREAARRGEQRLVVRALGLRCCSSRAVSASSSSTRLADADAGRDQLARCRAGARRSRTRAPRSRGPRRGRA